MRAATGAAPARTLAARNAVAAVFALNGFCFASWVSRIPDVRERLDLSNGQLGLLLLAMSAGSVLALPLTGALIERFGAAGVVLFGAVLDGLGLLLVSVGADALGVTALAALGLFLYGVGTGTWDVAMNVEGAAVEHELTRTIMPRFHAGFSIGTVFGALLGALAAGLHVPMAWHLGVVALVAVTAVLGAVRGFLPRALEVVGQTAGRVSAFTAWTEPRTLLIGLMVLALALTEGTANDWLAVALVDGYDVEHWVGVTGFAVFVAAMTVGRFWGSRLIDRHGRVSVLWSTMFVASAGLLLIVFGGHPAVVVVGIVLWGLGASLGFPVGMSAAADDPLRAAARVSVVSTIGYTAFLAGPPLLGFLAEEVGTLHALLVVVVLLVPSAFVVPAAREHPVRGLSRGLG
ncbi:MFS transporter [Nocardioides jensenii]|uniref:MFS transporter n=1 Tax=Nocardioides jensenii TaxID=1843 RepID=UPI00082B52F5|nr:MFS transporter [Nocardioides jensenii]